MSYSVYILRLQNGALYVGSTDNLARRLAEHRSGLGGRTTAMLRPLELLYFEPQPDRASAIQRERQLKRWSRAKKLALVHGDLQRLKRLSRCYSAQPGRSNACDMYQQNPKSRTGPLMRPLLFSGFCFLKFLVYFVNARRHFLLKPFCFRQPSIQVAQNFLKITLADGFLAFHAKSLYRREIAGC